MPIFHPRPARTPLLAGLEWFVFHSPHLGGGGVLIGASVTAAEHGAPAAVSVPLGLLSAWPLGLVARETAHSVRCWQLRQRQLHAEFHDSDQSERTYVTAERVTAEPVQLPADTARPLERAPGQVRVSDHDRDATEPRR